MSEGTALGVVRAWLEAFNDGERERFAGLLGPEVSFVQRATDERSDGDAAVEESFWRWRGGFLGLHGEIVDAFDAGERAVAQVEWTGLVKARGVEISFPACFVFTVRDGAIVDIVNYYDVLSFAKGLEG